MLSLAGDGAGRTDGVMDGGDREHYRYPDLRTSTIVADRTAQPTLRSTGLPPRRIDTASSSTTGLGRGGGHCDRSLTTRATSREATVRDAGHCAKALTARTATADSTRVRLRICNPKSKRSLLKLSMNIAATK